MNRTIHRTVGMVLAALLAAACGGGAGDPVTIDGLGAVASAAEAAGSARMEFRMEMAMMGQRIALIGEGVSDTATGESQMTMRGDGASAGILGENEMRTVDDTLYVRGPMAQQYAPGTPIPEGSWVAVDVSGAAALTSQQQTSAGDFSQMLDAMRAAGDGVEELGTDQLRGTEVEGYRGALTMRELYAESEISLEEAVEASLSYQPPAQREAARELVRQQLEQLMDVALTIEVWVDDQLLPHRMTMVMDFSEVVNASLPEDQQLDGGSTMTMTFDVLEYGVPIEIQAPPSDAVIEAA